uniref:Uncharacterized protein n=1 Tax=Mus spicilegus TaxID=10103 RepID=A0A8C6I629_MUSSI
MEAIQSCLHLSPTEDQACLSSPSIWSSHWHSDMKGWVKQRCIAEGLRLNSSFVGHTDLITGPMMSQGCTEHLHLILSVLEYQRRPLPLNEKTLKGHLKELQDQELPRNEELKEHDWTLGRMR